MALEIIKIETLDDLKAHVKAITAKARVSEVSAPEPDAPKSKMATDLLSVWGKADFGCQTPHVAQILRVLVREVAGEDVVFKTGKQSSYDFEYGYPRFSAVVPLSNPNGHDYPDGKAFIVNRLNSREAAAEGIMIGGKLGNNHGGKWRYATDAEIDELFETLDESVIEKF